MLGCQIEAGAHVASLLLPERRRSVEGSLEGL